jgi:hypothetical protein
MPVNDAKDLRPPIKYKPRPVARQLSRAEIKAAADRAEALSIRATAQVPNDPPKLLVRDEPRAYAPSRLVSGSHLTVQSARSTEIIVRIK